jgi:hypothetical protein
VLTLLVVPALYAIWFRVRGDEPSTSVQSELVDEPDWEAVPFRIAAE